MTLSLFRVTFSTVAATQQCPTTRVLSGNALAVFDLEFLHTMYVLCLQGTTRL
ncbi:hypothetical protein BAE44_0003845 [Dichanthelium oligosanthes]|uniref:Uncharacterized protein n=1 Tax=Dichanthelium oligosanthes TaxID=888268 RepID=A0A1E5WCI9_9POAL|nr:hypothetical protein BAE44_0003845 [Dichanthelium oligosanthes]